MTETDRRTTAFSPVPSCRQSPWNRHHPRRRRFASACWSPSRLPPEGRGVRGGKDRAVGSRTRNGMAATSSALGRTIQQYCESGRKLVASRRASTTRNGRMRRAGTVMASGSAAMVDFRAGCCWPGPKGARAGSLAMSFPLRGGPVARRFQPPGFPRAWWIAPRLYRQRCVGNRAARSGTIRADFAVVGIRWPPIARGLSPASAETACGFGERPAGRE